MKRIAALALGLIVAFIASAQDSFPTKPVRIIVPYPAGGPADLLPRVVGEKLAQKWGQPVVVENRSGANGNIGMEAVAKSRPDGHTLGACTIGNCAINASVYARMPYDIERDLVPVFWSASVINLLAVHPSVPARSLREFMDWAAANKGRVNYGSSGFGSSNHLSPELLNGRYGLGLIHVPFRGGAPALQALLAGQVQLMLENVPTLVAAAREGGIRPIAVTGRERDPALPDVPTFAEAGVPDVVVEPWFGYMAPAGTPEPVVRRLNALFGEALADEAVRARLRDRGARPEGGPPERFAAHVRSETARWRRVVEQNGIEKIE